MYIYTYILYVYLHIHIHITVIWDLRRGWFQRGWFQQIGYCKLESDITWLGGV